LNINVLRQCWWQVCGGRGMGNVHVKRLGSGDMEARVGRVASYISKYLTKETLVEFNRKSYWGSRVRLPEVRRYWLRSADRDGAVAELVQQLGLSLRFSFFSPDGEVFWAYQPRGFAEPAPF